MLYLPEVLNALQEAIFILDENRNVLMANSAADAMFGKSFIGLDFVNVTRHPDCIAAIRNVSIDSSNSKPIVAADHLTNTIHQIKVSNLGEINDDGARVLVSIKDISDMRDAEQMRTDFVANVSHELRSPLTAISGFIETLRTVPDMDIGNQNKFLELMNMEAQRMVRLIADLLSLSKVESRQRNRPEDMVDLKSILTRVQSNLAVQATKDGKTVELVSPSTIENIRGNEDELMQVFQNLIENAIKYGRTDSTIKVAIRENVSVPGLMTKAVVVEICDEGEGFDQHHIPRLTERFYRVDTHRSRNKGGDGVGISDRKAHHKPASRTPIDLQRKGNW